jgi:hypothetical protein
MQFLAMPKPEAEGVFLRQAFPKRQPVLIDHEAPGMQDLDGDLASLALYCTLSQSFVLTDGAIRPRAGVIKVCLLLHASACLGPLGREDSTKRTRRE